MRGCGGVPGICGEEDLLKGFESVSGDIFGVREEEVLIYCEEDIVEEFVKFVGFRGFEGWS